MLVILKKQWCGHVAGVAVSVSDDRAWNLMIADIAEPDADFLSTRKAQAEAMIKKASEKPKPEQIAVSSGAKGREKR